MSRLDDFERAEKEGKLMMEDVRILSKLKKEEITLPKEVADKFKSWNKEAPLQLLVEMINRPESRKLMEEIVEARVLKAKQEAIDECQDFLKKYVVDQVMEH